MSFADDLFLILTFENFQVFSRYLPLVGQGACEHFCTLWILFPSLLKGSFMKEDFFILMAFNISNFPFMGHIFVIISNNSFSNHKSPRLFSWMFYMFTFYFYAHYPFEILLVQIMRLGLTFVVYLWMSTCSSSIWWRLHFMHWIAFTSLLKIRWAFCVAIFLAPLICSTGFVSIPLPKPHFLNMENSKVNILNM